MAIPNGEIYLLKNIPLNPSYEHTIDFKDANEQFNYFISKSKYRFENYSYIRKDREFLRVELPFSSLDDVNYLIFRSAEGERLYYAFVTDRTYIDETTTDVFYIIDVMQTFQFDYQWRASYIKQAHVDRWTAQHKPIYSKTDEGLDYGAEYSVEKGFKIQQSNYLRWALVSIADPSESVSSGAVPEFGDFYPVASTFGCLLIPIVAYNPSDTSTPFGIIQAIHVTNNDIGNINEYRDFARLMNNSAIGNKIKSISILPYNPFVVSESFEAFEGIYAKMNVTFSSAVEIAKTTFDAGNGIGINCIYLQTVPSTFSFTRILAVDDWKIGLENTLPTSKQWDEIKANPYTTERDKRFESKLLCAPYRYNLLTDWRGDPVVFKNEYMTTDKLQINFSFALSYNAPFRYWVKDYKRDVEGRYTSLSEPLALEMPVVSDAYYTYMLENKNTIQANLTNAKINAVTGTVSGAISGGGIGGAGGAVFGAVSGAISGALNVQAHIRNENAKQADLKTKPDSMINSTDSAFNIIDGNSCICFYRMSICCENEEIIAQIFNMTGYKVNRVEIPNTRSRARFNYIQTVGANIIGNINQSDLIAIKEIYDKGVTIWHYTDDNTFKMLDYSLENIEVNLL